MKEHKVVDHLFRHQYGKMVAILVNYFGLSHIETIEDAIQDTFIKATLQWRMGIPDTPEAWLTKAAKNRTIDLLRQLKAEKNRIDIYAELDTTELNDLFLDHEVEDSQLRMIFVACHPSLSPQEQIAFSLKTISGFSMKEIASALLVKEDTIKKRLVRARKSIATNNIQFEFPLQNEVENRLSRVMDVIYLTFNEGFHSTNKNELVRKELCGEAIRLCSLLLKKEQFRSGSLYALFSLMCFHAARLPAKTSTENEIVDLENQDRSQWYLPLIVLGNDAMIKSESYEDLSTYYYEAAIAAEHLKAKTFKETNWEAILNWYKKLHLLHASPFTQLNMAIVKIQMGTYESALTLLDSININQLEQRSYLLFGSYAIYYEKTGNVKQAITFLEKAIAIVSNDLEKSYLLKKRALLLT